MPDTSHSGSLQAVFVLGPSSSGKTTLCNAVARDLQVESELYIREIARNVMKTRGFTRNDTHTYEMQEAIMLAQLQAEQKALNYASDGHECRGFLLLSDRSAIDPVVYAATSSIPDAAEIRERLLQIPSFQENLQFYRESLFSAYIPWTAPSYSMNCVHYSYSATGRGMDCRRRNQISAGPREL